MKGQSEPVRVGYLGTYDVPATVGENWPDVHSAFGVSTLGYMKGVEVHPHPFVTGADVGCLTCFDELRCKCCCLAVVSCVQNGVCVFATFSWVHVGRPVGRKSLSAAGRVPTSGEFVGGKLFRACGRKRCPGILETLDKSHCRSVDSPESRLQVQNRDIGESAVAIDEKMGEPVRHIKRVVNENSSPDILPTGTVVPVSYTHLTLPTICSV